MGLGMTFRLLIAAGVAVTLSSAHAQDAEEDAAIDAAIACRDISDPLQRLACLDAAAETLAVTRIIREGDEEEEGGSNAEPILEESFGLSSDDATEAETKRSATKPTETVEEFGSEFFPDEQRKREDRKLKSITSNVTEVRINKLGKVTVTLENGQVWRQLSSDNKSIRFYGKDRLYSATVKRSRFGNYLMTVDQLKRTIRVRRIK